MIHDPRGQILLLQRADIENFWQSVTGSLRWEETAHEAAVREVEEETGIDAVAQLVDWRRSATFDILDTFKPRYDPQVEQNLEHMFSLQVQVGQPIVLNPREHRDFAWLHYAEAAHAVWSWSNRSAIQRVAEKHWRGDQGVD